MWKTIDHKDYPEGGYEKTCRASVAGGWLVRTTTCVRSTLSVSTVFIPDEKHRWADPRQSK